MNPKYEKNEEQIALSLMNYYNIKDYNVYCNNTAFAPIDLDFNQANKKVNIEIKCRKELRIDYMIEFKKLNHLLKLIIENKKNRARYIMYIEDKDILIIFNLEKRIKKELKDIYSTLDRTIYYKSSGFQKNNAQGTYKKKYYKELFFNPEYDMVIYNYSAKIKDKNFDWKYENDKQAN